MRSFILAAQVSTSHSAREALTVPVVRKALQEAQAIIPFSMLITGARELPEIFMELTGPHTRKSGEVYIWYNLLSDYPHQAPDEWIVNFRGERCTGWGGWDANDKTQVEESFVFSCPNHPETRRKTLAGLEALLSTYAFDGVFLDKFRFPSPANGLEMVFSCFCPYCQIKARSQGLDLEKVRSALNSWKPGPDGEPTAFWLDELVLQQPILKQFLRFREESVLSLAKDVRALVDKMGRKCALDVFTPLLAPLVGQDYTQLVKLADWVKPMTYRRAYGPAGLRLEVESLIQGIQRIYHLSLEDILKWIEPFDPGFTQAAYRQMVEDAAPLDWIRREFQQAVQTLQPVPVLMGLETVNFPGVIEITPAMIREIVRTGLDQGMQGAVISWDLLHTPLENIQAIRDCL